MHLHEVQVSQDPVAHVRRQPIVSTKRRYSTDIYIFLIFASRIVVTIRNMQSYVLFLGYPSCVYASVCLPDSSDVFPESSTSVPKDTM